MASPSREGPKADEAFGGQRAGTQTEESTEPTATRKSELEERKLELEISDLRRSPWLRPSVMIPLVTALAILGLSQWLGVFDVARKQVELQAREASYQRDKLNDEVAQLKAQQQRLQQEAKDLDDRKAVLRQEIEKKNSALSIAGQSLKTTQAELAKTKATLGAPRIDFYLEHLTVALSARFTVMNSGHGVANIKRFQWFVDGRPVDGGLELKAALGLRDEDFRHVKINYPMVIATGEQIDLLRLEPSHANVALVEKFDIVMRKARVEVEYCSSLNKCDRTIWSH